MIQGIDKETVGEELGMEKNVELRKMFIDLMDYKEKDFGKSLREYLN